MGINTGVDWQCPEPYWKQETRKNGIYFTEEVKYGKQLSLSKNLQVEKKTIQVTINSNLLSYFTKPIQKTTQKT